MNITRAELKAAIDEAHRRHLKVTGHLCSVTYPEAVAAGIDNLEHGFFVNTQLDPGKQPDKCSEGTGTPTLLAMKPGSAQATALIKLLVDHHVALTSTLPVFEQSVPLHAPLQARQMDVLTPQAGNPISIPAISSAAALARRAASSLPRPTKTTWAWSGNSLRRAACCWRVRIRPATAA